MPVRIGVVGAGALGFHHTRILRDVPGAALVGSGFTVEFCNNGTKLSMSSASGGIPNWLAESSVRMYFES